MMMSKTTGNLSSNSSHFLAQRLSSHYRSQSMILISRGISLGIAIAFSAVGPLRIVVVDTEIAPEPAWLQLLVASFAAYAENGIVASSYWDPGMGSRAHWGSVFSPLYLQPHVEASLDRTVVGTVVSDRDDGGEQNVKEGVQEVILDPSLMSSRIWHRCFHHHSLFDPS